MIQLYEDLARASLENALDYLDSAYEIYHKGKVHVAYSLAVLSAEELGKSYICKGYSCEVYTAKDIDLIFSGKVAHSRKLQNVGKLMTAFFLIHNFFIPAVQQFSKEPNQSVDILLSAKIDPSIGVPIYEAFKFSEFLKLHTLYVDKINGKVRRPNAEFNDFDCKAIMGCLNTYGRGFESILKFSRDDFRTFHRVIIALFDQVAKLYVRDINTGKINIDIPDVRDQKTVLQVFQTFGQTFPY